MNLEAEVLGRLADIADLGDEVAENFLTGLGHRDGLAPDTVANYYAKEGFDERDR